MISIAECWGTTAEERSKRYPCDDLAGEGWSALYRSVSVTAPPRVVFRWLCQLRKAPYSYDLLDNFGRRSPRRLTPGLEHLAIGQSVMSMFRIASFEPDRHITLEYAPLLKKVMPPLFISYVVTPKSNGTRLTCKLTMPAPAGVSRKAAFRGVAWADWVMMRKQLLTIKALAEQQEERSAAA
ncbi:MAG TPA: hypothetical protein PKD61_28705 [Polyangiaceae bacterium]|nr:hypothetical protein [Polyangiaceae bacterium]